ncbi:ubiquitin-conjugating enzyme E2 [Cladophialophora carrionii]|uniref:Ubiquitin-conjugating enzyme E2 n=1 Tax=Cladophialophora carrionii TaxID=86049 RepID=A0A1C1CF13_9EURO|nr:ubiquitin-conjugating enzyme E2 [Cladophialophora carrionii]
MIQLDSPRLAGPYEGAILRFQISFPDTYPAVPPLIIFSSDIFHPLVVPLTTYTFSVSAVDASATVSASDQDRLPPGAFSLRHGFPQWFSSASLTDQKHDVSIATALDPGRPVTPSDAGARSDDAAEDNEASPEPPGRKSRTLTILQHLQDAFENADLLDEISLEAVGDPSAWHAWRAHRGLARRQRDQRSPEQNGQDASPSSPKHPGEWKWDGVWESRVRNGIEASISEAALFGNTTSNTRFAASPMESTTMDARERMLAAADRQIRFSKLSQERLDELIGQIRISDTTIPAP